MAFLVYTTPQKKYWVSSMWVLPSNHLSLIGGQQQQPNVADVSNIASLEHRGKVSGVDVKNGNWQRLAR